MNIEFSKYTREESNNFAKGVKYLTAWIAELKEAAKNDDQFSVSWFPGTANYPIAIAGGWQSGYDSSNADLFCMSKSHPNNAMCVKIAINDPNAAVDFEDLDLPVDSRGLVEDTCITLEWNDSPRSVAMFFMAELERLTKNCE